MALLGSLVGSALRSGLKAAEARLDADPEAPPPEMTMNVSGSAIAALAGGLMGLLFGTRTAFWGGVALGAAGIERFDVRVLRMAGVDVDALVARAMEMAERRGDAVDASDAETATTAVPVDVPLEEASTTGQA
jgi:hypothetical protein